MAKTGMNDLLKKRMTASQQASELQTSDRAYEKLFREVPPSVPVQICSLPLDKLVPFFTADIGFRPYSSSQLNAFAEQLNEEGLLVRIIVRPMAQGGCYEILAGHNRTNAARLAGWMEIPAEIVDADDARAIVIATSTNLIQRQNLSTSSSMEVIPLTGIPQGEYCYLASQLMLCLRSLSGTATLGVAQGGMLTLSTEDAFYMQTAMRPSAVVKSKGKPSAKKAA